MSNKINEGKPAGSRWTGVDKAVPIEIRNDKYRHTVRADDDLKNVFGLLSAYWDNGIVPVQLEVKEFINKDNILYVAVTLNKIKDAVLAKEGVSNKTSAMAVRIFIISLRNLLEKINPLDEGFLKYVPDGFLNDEQKAAKAAAPKTNHHLPISNRKNGSPVRIMQQGISPSTTSIFTISIRSFLEEVNKTYQSILSDDVLSCLGEKRNPQGCYSNRVKFSIKK